MAEIVNLNRKRKAANRAAERRKAAENQVRFGRPKGERATEKVEASRAAKELAGNMAIVTEAIDETNRSASAVLDASGALSAQAGTLQSAVDAFLHRVAAA